jgi:ABC-2 type transport system ATP-binding protein
MVSQASQPAIEMIGLTKTFRDFWMRQRVSAVRELSLNVQHGEVFGLLGPNGSGKTTTIKMILGLLHPTRGRVWIYGKPPSDVQVKHRLGFLPEETYLYRFLNAHETLDYYGRIFKIPRQERRRRIEMLLEMVGLSAGARRPIGEYSKGMARRIGLAQALINDPDLLILDEPTTGMDPIGSRQIKDLIVELGRRGKTILLSSHLLADCEDVCDRVSILYGGKVRAEGDVKHLLAKEELTQIITERLDEQTVRAIASLIERMEQKKVIQVGSPSDKLESLFLRIVEQARAERVETAGALGGGKIADFLAADRSSEGAGLIEQLIDRSLEDAARTVPAGAVSAETPRVPLPDAAVLEQLVGGGEREPRGADVPAGKTAEGSKPPAKPPAADRSVIDDLVRRAGQEKSPDA